MPNPIALVPVLLALALTATPPARAAAPEDYLGLWSNDAQACSQFVLRIAPAGKRLALSAVRNGGVIATTADVADRVEWALDEPGVAKGQRKVMVLEPHDGGLTIRFGLESSTERSPPSPLARCAFGGAPPPVALKTRDEKGLAAALATYAKTFGPSWLDGAFGYVDSGEDGLVAASALPGMPFSARATETCVREWRGLARSFPAMAKSFANSAPADPTVVATNEGVEVPVQGAWTFFTGRGGKPFFVTRAMGFGGPVAGAPTPVETFEPKTKGKGPRFGVVLGGVRWVVSIADREEWRVAPDGGLGHVRDLVPEAVDVSSFVMLLKEDGGLDERRVARCQ